MAKTPYGLVATFLTAPDAYHAAEKARDAGFSKWDLHSPFPIHGIDKAMGLPRSIVPRFTLAGGILGFFTGMLIVWYMNWDYPLIVGGKPYFSPIFPFPIFYELTILLAAFGTLGGMFLINLLPRLNHPFFDYANYGESSDDKFQLVIEVEDPRYDPVATRDFLHEIGGLNIELIEAED
jgi:hypothetical protein